MEFVHRNEYLDFLNVWKDKRVIKVISGIRRCGKSTLLELYKRLLLENGVAEEQITSINFEDINYDHLTDYRELHKSVCSRLLGDKANYVFLDEVQHVKQFERAVDSLFIRENVDLYITGSNAYFMSGEQATLLSGRYVELKMLPLSFKEYHSFTAGKTSDSTQSIFNNYLRQSSFPYVLQLDGQQRAIDTYLKDIFDSILLKDVVARLKISDVMMLESVVKYMASNIGSKLSASKIARTLTSMGRKIDQRTVEKYIKGLTESLMFYPVRRYSLRGKQLLAPLEKYYLVDMGLRYAYLGNKGADRGHVLENVVFLELIRRGCEVYIGQNGGGDEEVDFVAVTPESRTYLQVAATVLDENTLTRELGPLRKITDHYPKYLLTLDEIGDGADFEGIKQKNVLDWLLMR
jgi:predicted AAA+ superfamily ATPase